MKSLRLHTPLLILAVCVTVLVLVLYAYMYYQVRTSTQKALDARELATAEQYNKSKEADLIKVYEATIPDRERLATYFIPAHSTVAFIEAIESIGPASGSDLKLSSIDASAMEDASPGESGEITAHIEASGAWSAVMKSLMLAERMPYKITVENVRLDVITEGTPKSSSKKWKIGFDMKARIISTPLKSSTSAGDPTQTSTSTP